MTDSADHESEKYTQTIQPFEYVKSRYFLFYNNWANPRSLIGQELLSMRV